MKVKNKGFALIGVLGFLSVVLISLQALSLQQMNDIKIHQQMKKELNQQVERFNKEVKGEKHDKR